MLPIFANVKKSVAKLKGEPATAAAETVVAESAADPVTVHAPATVATFVARRRESYTTRTLTHAAAAPASTRSSFAPAALAATAAIARASNPRVFTADRPRFHSACATIAMTTGVIPYSTPATFGSAPYRVYPQAIAITMIIAGTMNESPATTRPGQPPRP